jgi:eukaryotic-like serine/threonine-protein kinase
MLPTAPRKEYATGDVISGKYRLAELLGEGGMGSVWVAENMALKANVALKLIRADVAESSANERFLSEARLAARLQHAAIVRVFDFGKTENEEPFIVMELLEGETLGQRLTRLGSIDPTELVQTILPIIDALHSAHGHGVIHRDLKPDNVFIAKADGGGVQPKLLDFGIAKLRGESAFLTTKLTQAGTLIGSPDYMSPEQARGETDLDPRSDVWALCVLAYECLVGKPPFHGDNYNALLWAIIHDEPVPITVFQAGDSELWRLLKTGFAKDRTARWDSARKFGEALAQWLENQGVVEDVCNRSLHASWLPAERPTRPELAPFDPLAPPPARGGSAHAASTQAALRASSHPAWSHAASSQAAAAPPPTLVGLRRPRALSLWFAGVGLLTLLGAMLLGSHTGDGATDPDVELKNASPAVLPPAASAPLSPATAQLPRTPGAPLVAADAPPQAAAPGGVSRPIGEATIESGAAQPQPPSWTKNHDKIAEDRDLAQEFKHGVQGSDVQKTRGLAEAPSGRRAPPASKPAPAPRPKATAHPSAPKKAVPEKSEPVEFDFGI